jgi:hypothetical protein
MALEEKMKETPKKEPMDDRDIDLKIAVLMGMDLLDKGGFDVIEKAVDESSDPSQVIGQFILQLGQQLHEKMPDDLKFDPGIMLEEGGWVEQISDYIQAQIGVSAEIMDKAEIYVAHTATQMAQNKAAPAAAAAAQAPEGAPMPQGAM